MSTLLRTVEVALDHAGYDILIGRGLLKAPADWLAPLFPKGLARRKIALIADAGVMPLYGRDLARTLEALTGQGCILRILPQGEGAKSFAELEKTLDVMLSAGVDRGTLVVALGGGVTGDHAGFAAAIALRGLDFVQVPTTLLAMVDSSVGGKTGINAPQGKNLVGAFYQPRRVAIDLDVLETLPEREYLAGYAEIVKYAFIRDAGFFDWLEAHKDAVKHRDIDALAHIVAASCTHKADVVGQDEKETGIRALLNFGHTFAHALETENAYDASLLHGEAVAIGMAMAYDLSVAMGLCPAEDVARARAHMQAMGLRQDIKGISGLASANVPGLIAHMRKDKKVRDGKMRFILARGIGDAFVSDDVDEATLAAVLQKWVQH